MSRPFMIAVAASLVAAAAAFAQTPAPSTPTLGGPTATAGSSAQSNAPAPSGAKTAVHHAKTHRMKPASAAKGSALPDGQGGASTPSGR